MDKDRAEGLLEKAKGTVKEVAGKVTGDTKLEAEGKAQKAGGTVQLPARLHAGVSRGMIFVPFHWGDLYAAGNAANYLTISAIGRVAKQPELKFCAVALEKVVAARPHEVELSAPV